MHMDCISELAECSIEVDVFPEIVLCADTEEEEESVVKLEVSSDNETIPTKPKVKENRTYETRNKYPCGNCEAVFTDLTYLTGHLKCCRAKRIFENAAALLEGPSHLDPPPFDPPQAYYDSASIADSILRQDTKQILKRARRYPCDECAYVSKQLGDLRKHKMIHTGHKPFCCEFCGYSSNRFDNYRIHKRIHTGEKPFACDECSYASSYLNAYKRHKLTHSSDKPFACTECSYASVEPGRLKKHMRTHCPIKPYACDECNYSCKEYSNLRAHKRTHTGEKPYACDMCSYVSTQQSTLKRHKATHKAKTKVKKSLKTA